MFWRPVYAPVGTGAAWPAVMNVPLGCLLTLWGRYTVDPSNATAPQ